MSKLALSVAFVSICFVSFAQTYTMCSTNSWNGATAWTAGSCGSGNTTIPNCSSSPCAINAVINSGVNPATANGTYGVNNLTIGINTTNLTVSGGSLTVYGTLLGNGDNTIQVNGSATLTVAQLHMAGNNPVIQVNGTLHITGNAVFDNKVSWTVNGGGQVIIDGNLTLTNGASMQVNGSLKVHGNLSTGNNTDLTINGGGTVTVDNNVSIGSGNLNGAGTFQFGGTCCLGGNCSSNTSYCNSSHHNFTLPITLTSFNVSINHTKIDLTWSTATELNFDYFSLEKSSDGKLFNEIAQVKGHGTTNEKHDYSFDDNFPLIGKNYYRLTSVDFDNYKEAFKVIVQDYSGEKDSQVSPNPTDGQMITLNFNFDTKEGQVVIYDSMGSMVDFFQVNETGVVSFTNPLKDGIYFAKCSSPSFNKTIRFLVKQ